MALVLTCKDGDEVFVAGGVVKIKVALGKRRSKAQLVFDAPAHVAIDRSSVHQRRLEASRRQEDRGTARDPSFEG